MIFATYKEWVVDKTKLVLEAKQFFFENKHRF